MTKPVDYFAGRKIDSLGELSDMYSSVIDLMRSLDVDNEEDEKIFYCIYFNVPYLVKDILGKKPSPDVYSKVSDHLYKNKDNFDISNLYEFMNATRDALESAGYSEKILSKAYPNHTGYPDYIKPEHNLDRWVNATKRIYLLMRKGLSRNQAFEETTKDWEKMVKDDYQQWLKLHEAGVPTHYKIAQHYISDQVFIPDPDRLRSRMPIPDSNKLSDNKKTQTIKQKIISRLLAAEKLLESGEGTNFVGGDIDLILKMLHDLKRKIQTIHSKSAKSYEDQIYKTAYLLAHEGHEHESKYFEKLAQEADLLGGDPMAGMAPPQPPGGALEAPPEDGAAGGKETTTALTEFFDRLEKGVTEPENEVRDRRREKEKNRKKKASYEDLLKVAQEVAARDEDRTDDIIEAALKNISINDVIKRLEMLVTIYNQRDIARQLSILDIMMDRLGLASFFPSLTEAMGKSLESNQYIGTRLEGILTKLKGSVESASAQKWIKPERENSPDTQAIQNNLQQESDQEKARKELRKQRDMEKLERRQQPQVEPAAELAQPVSIETPGAQ